MGRNAQLGYATVVPAIAKHGQHARNGFARADAIALLSSSLKKVGLQWQAPLCHAVQQGLYVSCALLLRSQKLMWTTIFI